MKGICWEFALEEAMVDGSDTMKELEANAKYRDKNKENVV